MAGDRYAADPLEAFSRIDLDGLTALYHRKSGMTHILASPAPELIEALAGEPADAETLHARLSARFEVAQGEALEARLAELEAAGLVRRT